MRGIPGSYLKNANSATDKHGYTQISEPSTEFILPPMNADERRQGQEGY
jgi:hypothetical protein